MESTEINTKKQKQEDPSYRIFVSNVKTYFGKELVKKLSAQNLDNPHLILGSDNFQELVIDNLLYDVPTGIRKVIDTKNLMTFKQLLLDSDIIIYDLNNCDQSEFEFVVKTLKMNELKTEKILICISSVMVWSNTPPKEKKPDDEEEAEDPDDQEEPDSEPEIDEEEEKKQEQEQEENEEEKKEYVRFKETDFNLRKPFPKYEPLRSLETLCLSASFQKKNLKSYVLCSGIQYGCGEQVFFEQFKQAWLQHPRTLQIYGNGKNRIPSIHVQDLAEYVKQTIMKKPKQQYIFAIDQNKKPTQKSIIQSISKSLGTGAIEFTELPENYEYSNEYLDKQLIHLRMIPSKSFEPSEEEEEDAQQNQEEEEEMDEAQLEALKQKKLFQWHSKEGFQKNIQKLIFEFNQYRGLKSNKIFIYGPPSCGKSYYAEKLANHYNIPHLKIKDILDNLLQEKTEFAEKINEYIKGKYEEEEEKLKELEQEGQKVDFSKIDIRLPNTYLYKILKKRLMKNDCLNRGYILDGFPRTFKDAQKLFLMKVKTEEEGEEEEKQEDDDELEEEPEEEQNEEEQEEEIKMTVNPTLIPNCLIQFEASNDYLKKFVLNLPEELVESTHLNQQDLERRLKIYNKNNNKANGLPNILTFFEENQIDSTILNIENKKCDHFTIIKSYIERKEKFKNYQYDEIIQENKRIEEVEKKKNELQLKQEKEIQLKNKRETELRDLVQEEYKLTMEDIKKKDDEQLNIQSQPLRDYLNHNVVSFISDGLLKVIKEKPYDPIDFLAEFFFDKSLYVEYPDPLSFLKHQQAEDK